MIDKEKIKELISNNKWVILSALFFVIWKFFLIRTMFDIDFNDLRFKDATVYISHINSIITCSPFIFCKDFLASFTGYGGFEHLTYRLFFGTIGKVLGLNAQNAFIASFYIGILMIIPVLTLLLKRITPNKNLIAFSLFFLALYNGAGSYHGFFWIVPSFFSLLLFFLIFSVITGKYKHWKFYIAILVPSILYTHYIGLYMLSVLFFFPIFYGYFNKKIDKLLVKKTIFAILVAIVFYIPTSLYLKDSLYSGNPYGIGTFTKQTVGNLLKQNVQNTTPVITITDKINFYFPSIGQIKTDYFDFIFPHWFFIFVFAIIIGTLFLYKQYLVLALYFSCLVFTLISSINIYGARSLLITWPITFVLYAHGIWFFFRLIKENVHAKSAKYLLKLMIVICIIIFTIANLMYSYLYNNNHQASIKKIFFNVLMNK